MYHIFTRTRKYIRISRPVAIYNCAQKFKDYKNQVTPPPPQKKAHAFDKERELYACDISKYDL